MERRDSDSTAQGHSTTSNDRRSDIPGAFYCFTVVTHRREPSFAAGRNVERLREGFRRVMARHPFQIDAIVVLPDHHNPVKHGYVMRPGDWPWSSLGRALRRGWYPPGWGELEPASLRGMDVE